jgi:hypothetical protein
MSWLILLLISCIIIICTSCDKSNVNINNDDEKEYYSRKISDDNSLCDDQVCRRIIDIYCKKNLMEEHGRFFYLTSRWLYTSACVCCKQLSGYFFSPRCFFKCTSVSIFSFTEGMGYICTPCFSLALFPFWPLCGRHNTHAMISFYVILF